MINSMLKPIKDDFGLIESQMGFVMSRSLLAAAVLYPLWGYLFNRSSRSKLLGIASFSLGLPPG
jgi:MFS family permease